MRNMVGILVALGAISGAFAAVTPMSETEQTAMRRKLLPLPHVIEVKGKVRLKPSDIMVRVGKKDAVAANAAVEMARFLAKKNAAKTPDASFEILVGIIEENGAVGGVPVPDWEKLKSFPNNDQAYLIRPVGETRLVVAALDGKGVYYGVQTLKQLLSGISSETVEIPLVSIDDWPDLRERGVWNGNGWQVLDWMTAMKLNFCVVNTVPKYRKGEAATVAFDSGFTQKDWAAAKNQACVVMPKVTHINFHKRYGLYDVYPELAGKGEKAFQKRNPNKDHHCPCASNPVLKEVVYENFKGCAALGVREVTAWFSEYDSTCECPECLKKGQFPLETIAFREAFEKIKKEYPDFMVRFFLSYDPPNFDWAPIVKEIPEDAKIERACFAPTETRNGRKVRSDYPIFNELAAKGRRLASYMLPYNGVFDNFPTYRNEIESLVQRKYQGGYALSNWYYGALNRYFGNLNISAIAEWGWNVNGRDTRAFAEAWAEQNGYPNPEAVGDWAALAGPILYDLGFCQAPPWAYLTRAVNDAFAKPPRRTAFGADFLAGFSSANDLDAKTVEMEKALTLARSFPNPFLALGTEKALLRLRFARAAQRVNAALADEKDATALGNEIRSLFAAWKDADRQEFAAVPEALRKAWPSYVKGQFDARVKAAEQGEETFFKLLK